MQDAAVFVNPIDALANLPTQQLEFTGYGDKGDGTFAKKGGHLAENPWRSNRGTSDHHAVDAVGFKGVHEGFGSRDVTVAYDRNVQTWIGLHFSYHLPVGFAGVHLRAGASMDRQGLFWSYGPSRDESLR